MTTNINTTKVNKLRVLLFGWCGVGNTGSEAKLLTTIEDVKKTIGKDRIEKIGVVSVGPVNERRYVEDPNIEIYSFLPTSEGGLTSLYKLIAGERWDLLFLCEGSTYLDRYNDLFLWAFMMAARIQKMRGGKVVGYSNDCGNLKPYNQRAARNTLNNYVDLQMIRNPDARTRMEQYGVKRELHLTADGAYLYPLPPKEYREKLLKELNLGDKPIISIATKEFFVLPMIPKLYPGKDRVPLDWLYRKELGYTPMISKEAYVPKIYLEMREEKLRKSEEYKKEMTQYADYLVEKFGANVLLIGMASFEGDGINAREIYDSMKNKKDARWIPSHVYNAKAIKTLLCSSKHLITTRYHASVLSSMAGVPMIAISSDTRLEAVFRELNLMDLYLEVKIDPPTIPENLYDMLVEKTETLVNREEKIKRKIKEADKNFVKRAEQNSILLKQWFDKEFER
jgi:polysaccharide pyruvyl transferase WcaK-like protein